MSVKSHKIKSHQYNKPVILAPAENSADVMGKLDIVNIDKALNVEGSQKSMAHSFIN